MNPLQQQKHGTTKYWLQNESWQPQQELRAVRVVSRDHWLSWFATQAQRLPDFTVVLTLNCRDAVAIFCI